MRKQEGEKRLDKKREENKVRGGKRGSHVEDLIPQSAHVSLPYLLLLPSCSFPIHPFTRLWCSSILIKPAHHPPTLFPPPHLLLLLFFPLCLTFIHSSSFFLLHSLILLLPALIFTCGFTLLPPWLLATGHSSCHSHQLLLVTLHLSWFMIRARHSQTLSALSLTPTFRLNGHFAAASLFRAKISFDVLLTDHWLPYLDVPEFITANLGGAIKN